MDPLMIGILVLSFGVGMALNFVYLRRKLKANLNSQFESKFAKDFQEKVKDELIKRIEEKIKNGEIKPLHLADTTDNVLVDKNTGEVITNEDIESDTHTDSYMNKDDNNLSTSTSTQTSDRKVLIENRKQILKSIGKSDKEIEELINKEFYDDVPF